MEDAEFDEDLVYNEDIDKDFFGKREKHQIDIAV